MRTRELAKKVLSVLERDGWCQKTYVNEAGQHCIIGATIASKSTGLVCSKFFAKLTELTGEPVIPWNDTPGRSFAEVKALLKKASR